jgi:two-component sensor histidine kinase
MGRELIQIACLSHPDLVDRVRGLAETVTLAEFGPKFAEKASLAAHELVENAVRFGALTTKLNIHVAVDDSNLNLTVSVTNSALPSRIGLLTHHVDRLRRLSPAGGMAEFLRPNGIRTTIQLGLARVRFEAQMDLRVDLAKERVTVVAAAPL